MVTLVGCATTGGTILKFRVLVGSCTTSCAGTGATAGLLLTMWTTAPPGGASEVRSARARTALPPAVVLADNVNEARAIPMLSSLTEELDLTLSAVTPAECENGPGPVTRTVIHISSTSNVFGPIAGIRQVTVFCAA